MDVYPSIFIIALREKKIFIDLDWKAKLRIFLIKFLDIIPISTKVLASSFRLDDLSALSDGAACSVE